MGIKRNFIKDLWYLKDVKVRLDLISLDGSEDVCLLFHNGERHIILDIGNMMYLKDALNNTIEKYNRALEFAEFSSSKTSEKRREVSSEEFEEFLLNQDAEREEMIRRKEQGLEDY